MSNPKATYGIIGYPVSHSLSPLMHNTAFKELGIDATYKLFPLKEEEIKPFFQDLRTKTSTIFGLNVTVPYKELVLEFLDNLSPFAKRAMSVNTIVISPDRKMVGYNTDGPGFLAHLAELKFTTNNKRLAILGAGGTTRAILTALCLIPERPETIKIYNRTGDTAKRLIDDLAQRMDTSNVEIVHSIDDLNVELADLLINTTSVGLKDPDATLVGSDVLHEDMLVYDVVYDPAQTRLLQLAEEKGAQTANGLGLLFYQGMLSFQHWANLELDPDLKAKIRKFLEKGQHE